MSGRIPFGIRLGKSGINIAGDSADGGFMLALSIRQPYAELILRGVKTIEYRSRPTKMIGQRFYIYAARKWAGVPGTNGHDNGFALSSGPSPGPRNPADPRNPAIPQPNGLPRGVIVGSAVIAKCLQHNGLYEWHLSDVKRYKRPRTVKRQPQPVWFRPF